MVRKPSSYTVPTKSGRIEFLNYDEGIKAIRKRIDGLLEEQDLVTMAINHSAPDVGKTRLSTRIARDLLQKRVPNGLCPNPDYLNLADVQVSLYREQLNEPAKRVYIFDAWEVPHGVREAKGIGRDFHDFTLRKAAQELGLSLEKIDLWVALSSKEKPFLLPKKWSGENYDPFEDIFICNEKAIIDSGKMRRQ